MNVIGQIGKFIMDYQEAIFICVIVAVVILVVCIVGKLIANAGKKRKMLIQMGEDISEINASVKALREKKTEVIYIDGRSGSESRIIPTNPVHMQEMPAAVVTCAPQEVAQAAAEPESADAGQASALKYFSRDCGISKDGKQYTIEELDAQIKD